MFYLTTRKTISCWQVSSEWSRHKHTSTTRLIPEVAVSVPGSSRNSSSAATSATTCTTAAAELDLVELASELKLHATRVGVLHAVLPFANRLAVDRRTFHKMHLVHTWTIFTLH